jgi:NAD(P)H-nitrite reductase large subunit
MNLLKKTGISNLIEEFNKNYEVCSCHKITLEKIIIEIKLNDLKTLRDIQEETRAGTLCRHCIFPEGDFGKVKKQIYIKDILKEVAIG